MVKNKQVFYDVFKRAALFSLFVLFLFSLTYISTAAQGDAVLYTNEEQTELPATAEPSTKETLTKEAATEEPTTEEPTTEEPTTEEPTTEEFIPNEKPIKPINGRFVASKITHAIGRITAKDARKALRYSASIESLTLDELKNYDIDLNGKITAFDAKLLIRIATNLDDYFIMDDGSRLSGWTIDNKGNKYYRNSYGAKLFGWQELFNEYYYFYPESGILAVNTVVEDYSIDSNGKRSGILPLSKATLPWKIKRILDQEGYSVKAIFNYVAYNYSYKSVGMQDPDSMVIYMLNYRKGACYHYAYLTKYLLDAAGYENYMIDGYSNTGRHFWNLVKVNGKWYHLDTQKKFYLFNDNDLHRRNFRWNKSSLPKVG